MEEFDCLSVKDLDAPRAEVFSRRKPAKVKFYNQDCKIIPLYPKLDDILKLYDHLLVARQRAEMIRSWMICDAWPGDLFELRRKMVFDAENRLRNELWSIRDVPWC